MDDEIFIFCFSVHTYALLFLPFIVCCSLFVVHCLLFVHVIIAWSHHLFLSSLAVFDQKHLCNPWKACDTNGKGYPAHTSIAWKKRLVGCGRERKPSSFQRRRVHSNTFFSLSSFFEAISFNVLFSFFCLYILF
jgi:hypothetical protein